MEHDHIGISESDQTAHEHTAVDLGSAPSPFEDAGFQSMSAASEDTHHYSYDGDTDAHIIGDAFSHLPTYDEAANGHSFDVVDPSSYAVGDSPGNADNVVGNPAGEDQYWMYQGDGLGTCAPTSVTMILETVLSEKLDSTSVIARAEQLGLLQYDPSNPAWEGGYSGMTDQGIMELAQSYGLSVDGTSGNSISDLENTLGSGSNVMVSLDAYELWNPDQDSQLDPSHTANHEVVVTGVDETKGLVYLNDSGTPNGQQEVIPLNQFEAAWAASNHTMIYTNKPGADEAQTVDPTGLTPPTENVDPSVRFQSQQETGGSSQSQVSVEVPGQDPTASPEEYPPLEQRQLAEQSDTTAAKVEGQPHQDPATAKVLNEQSLLRPQPSWVILPFTFVAVLRDLLR